MKKNKLTVSGFTLIELIVVVAIFGMIIAATLTFIAPLNRVFNNTQAYVASSGAVDNVRRALEDNLRFANRMEIYAAPEITGSEQDFITAKVTDFRKAYFIGNSVTNNVRQTYAKDKIYVLKINNPEQFKDLSAGSEPPGKISLWSYTNGSTTADTSSKEWLVSQAVYQDFGFSLSYGIQWTTDTQTYLGKPREMITDGTYEDFNKLTNEGNFTLVLDVYGINYADTNNKASSDYSLYKSNVSNEVTLSFENLNSKISGVKSTDDFTVLDSTVTPPVEKTCSVERYRYHSPAAGVTTKDIYFIYTLPEIG